MNCWTADEDRVVAAARAPARLLVGLEVGLGQRRAGRRCRAVGRRDRAHCRSSDLAARSRPRTAAGPATLRERLDVDEELARSTCASWPVFISGTSTRSNDAQHVAGVRRQRVEVVQVGAARPGGRRSRSAAHGGADRAVARAPAEHQQRRRPGRRRPRAAAARRRSRRSWPRRSSVIRCVVGARRRRCCRCAVGLLDARRSGAARPGVPGTAHGRAAVGVARVGQERLVAVPAAVANAGSIAGSVGDVRDQPRLRGVGQEAVGEQDHRRAVADRDPRPPRTPRRSSRPACVGAIIGSGDSPWRP